jgi:hypothetical protein
MASNKVGRTVLTMAVVAVISATSLPARAETDITGSPDALRVEAHDTALQAVVTALGVRIWTSADSSGRWDIQGIAARSDSATA